MPHLTSSAPPPPGTSGAVAREREEIRSTLLRSRPELAGRIGTGPSGSLTIPRPGGAGVEIGRMRRSGRARWVVVASDGGPPAVRTAASAQHAARLALAALSVAQGSPGAARRGTAAAIPAPRR